MTEQRIVRSADGTPLALYSGGRGPDLLLVHGSSSDHNRWAGIRAPLEEQFTVHALERRGRGDSGFGNDYSLEREVQDIVAAAASIGAPLAVLGHSYGAIATLEAAPRITGLSHLILYEPPVPTRIAPHPEGVTGRIQAAVDAGDPDRAYTIFAREVLQRSPEDVDKLRRLRIWGVYVSMVHTLPREMAEVDAYRFDAQRYRGLDVPTLLLLGERSPPLFGAALELVRGSLVNSVTVTLPGQEHVAMDTAPRMFVAEVVRFLHS